MDFLSPEFLSALLAIVVIDLVLAGDNAIVIALAARNLPPTLRKRAVIWGTVGAIVVRSALTLVVVWLLKIPGLQAIGGALLVWIAYKLLVDSGGGESEHEVGAANDFWGAMRTIVIADALMGLDNVLAVAGAAGGSFLLVVLGLLISIPIVIWGSQLILKYVERFPIIVYIGAGVLAWTAVKMIAGEPLLKPWAEAYPLAVAAAYLLVIGGTLGLGFLVNHSKVRARVREFIVDIAAPAGAAPEPPAKVLLPVDGSPSSLVAVQYAVRRYMQEHGEVHLLHVRPAFSKHVAAFVSRGDQAAYHREQGGKALAAARALLDRYGVPYALHVEVGPRAETIASMAETLGVSHIIIGTRHRNALRRIVEESVAHRVLELVKVPVEVVATR